MNKKIVTKKFNIEQKRLNVMMDKATYKIIKEHCVQNDTSISEITRFLWIKYMDSFKTDIT